MAGSRVEVVCLAVGALFLAAAANLWSSSGSGDAALAGVCAAVGLAGVLTASISTGIRLAASRRDVQDD